MSDSQWRTTQPSRLYFANMRQSQYYHERGRGTRIDTYRHRKFSNSTKRPLIIPTIIDKWMEDEAYIFLRRNDYPDYSNYITLQWRTAQDSVLGSYELQRQSRQKQYELAGEIYDQLLQEHKIYVLQADSTYARMYADKDDRQAYLTTMKDYYRLTERY